MKCGVPLVNATPRLRPSRLQLVPNLSPKLQLLTSPVIQLCHCAIDTKDKIARAFRILWPFRNASNAMIVWVKIVDERNP